MRVGERVKLEDAVLTHERHFVRGRIIILSQGSSDQSNDQGPETWNTAAATKCENGSKDSY